jgi:ribonuclease-3
VVVRLVGVPTRWPVTTAAQPEPDPLDEALGVALDADLLERALTHRSYAHEAGGLPTNERLEFLGDAVLGLVVTEALYRRNPDLAEGRLAKLRAGTVNTRALASVARELGVGAHVRLGRGEVGTGGRDKDSILADTLEALIGAVYVQHGLTPAAAMVQRLFDPVMADTSRLSAGLDWKTSLQELTAAQGRGAPEYVISETGPAHAKSFTARVLVDGDVRGEGAGRTKKLAELNAAAVAWEALSAAAGALDGQPAGEGEPARAGA